VEVVGARDVTSLCLVSVHPPSCNYKGTFYPIVGFSDDAR
jgi:hypothetical protein